jgi:uncharacterized protein (DUF2267 family)
MDELIKLVSEKANISAEQAKQAVESVLAFIKDKLPGPIGDQVTNLLSGAGGLMGQAGGAMGDVVGKAGETLGGLFGGKKS